MTRTELAVLGAIVTGLVLVGITTSRPNCVDGTEPALRFGFARPAIHWECLIDRERFPTDEAFTEWRKAQCLASEGCIWIDEWNAGWDTSGIAK